MSTQLIFDPALNLFPDDFVQAWNASQKHRETANARVIQDEENRAYTLQSLTPYLQSWAKEETETARRVVIDTMDVLSKHSRPEFLNDLHRLLPFWIALIPDEENEILAGEIFESNTAYKAHSGIR